MLQEISSEIDYVTEGVALLHHIGSDRSFPALKESLCKKYDITLQAGNRKFELLTRIEQNARNVFREDMKEIRYYFSIYGANETNSPNVSCAGMLTLLWRNHSEKFKDTEEIRAYLHALSEEDYCEKFGIELQLYNEILKDESKLLHIKEPLAIISYLMKMEITDEEKWKLQKVFCDKIEHQEKVLSFLEKAITVLKSFQAELDELIAQFVHCWNEKLKSHSIAAYMRKIAMIDLAENPFGFCLLPSVIDCNQISLNMELETDGSYKQPDIYIVGILFGDDFQIWANHAEDDRIYANYATQVLKLLSDKSKFEILSYIRDKESYGSELAKHLHLTTPTVSHHMNALIAAELVTIKRSENRVYYLPNKEKIDEVLRYCNKKLTGNDTTL